MRESNSIYIKWYVYSRLLRPIKALHVLGPALYVGSTALTLAQALFSHAAELLICLTSSLLTCS